MRNNKNRAVLGALLLLGAFSGSLFMSTNGWAARPASNYSPSDPGACEAVSWLNLVNVTALGNTIMKTGGVNSVWDAGAASTRAIQSGDGSVQVTIDSVTIQRMFGLSYGDSHPRGNDIDYAFYTSGSGVKIIERGLGKTTYNGNISPGDTLRVAVESGEVRYYINQILIYISATPPYYPLLLDTSISTVGGQVAGGTLCGANLGSSATSTPVRTATPTSAAINTATKSPTRTATRTSTPAPSGTPGELGNCRAFPADNIWNKNIAALPTHAMSAQYIANISLGDPLHASFGSGIWDGGPIGEPFITVPGNQPRVPMTFVWPRESDPGPYPIPTNAPIEGGPNSTGDRHVLVIDRDTCLDYELYHANPHADGSWDAGSGARWDLNSNTLRPNGWTSADAAGLPILPGLITYDQVQSGVIRHATRFTAPLTQNSHVWPARHHSQQNADPNLPPMGLRVRLKAGTNISVYPAQLRVILQGLKDYGMILADNGDAWNIDGSPDARWNDDTLWLLGQLHGSDFEAVDVSSLMIDPNSGQSR
jgi:hypothetical protein